MMANIELRGTIIARLMYYQSNSTRLEIELGILKAKQNNPLSK